MKKFPFYKQADYKDCGPTCLKIVAKFYGKFINIQRLREFSESTREGSNLLFLSDAAEKIGFRTMVFIQLVSPIPILFLQIFFHLGI